MIRRLVVTSLPLLGSGCVLAPEEPPRADVRADLESAYVFRGQVMNERGIARAEGVLEADTKDDGTLVLLTRGFFDLDDRTGDAWLPDGSGGELSELDVSAAYARRVGPVGLAVGLLHYVWPDAEDFPFGPPFEPVTELFVEASGEALGLTPAVVLHYEVDEVHGFYGRASVGRALRLADAWSVELLGWVGFSDGAHSEWLYRRDHAGVSDLAGTATLVWDLDPTTRLELAVAGSTILDGGLRRWFGDNDVDADSAWATLGVAWSL